MKRKSIMIAFLVSSFFLFLSPQPVLADVPTVLSVEASKEGGRIILVFEVRHSAPTSSHYVDVIEVEVEERLDRITDLSPQTSTVFEYNHDIGEIQYENIRMRAHCTLHGWSSWATLGAVPEKPFWETPLGTVTVVAGIAVILFIVAFLAMRQRRR